MPSFIIANSAKINYCAFIWMLWVVQCKHEQKHNKARVKKVQPIYGWTSSVAGYNNINFK